MMNRIAHTLRRPIARAAVLGWALAGSGCLAATDVSLADIVGDWVATEARLANVANINETLDVTDLGWEVTLQIDADGTYTLVIDEPGAEPDVRIGTITVENGKDVTVAGPAGTIGGGEVFLEDDQVAILFDKFAGLTADIKGDGNRIAVTLLLVMVRQ
jgi:hypothetical protein